MALNAFVQHMMRFQELNNIKKECVTNSWLLYQFMVQNGYDVKAKAVIAVSTEDSQVEIIEGHMVLSYDDDIVIDPSFEIVTKPNLKYFDSIQCVVKYLPKLKEEKQRVVDMLKEHMKFREVADIINKGESEPNTTYYDTLFNYLDARMKVFFKQNLTGRVGRAKRL